MEIKTNTMVIITPKMNLLQIPIIDKFYVRPSDPAALTRNTEFAREKGLLNPRTTIGAVGNWDENKDIKHVCC
jgi:glutamine amidotransferase